MPEIKVTPGKVALVDEQDYTRLAELNWCINAGYAGRRVGGTIWYMHWYVLGKPPKGKVTDHINGNKLDNRRENLRIITQQENTLNTKRHKGRTGVSVDRTHGTSKAYLDRPGLLRRNLGTFKTREEAEAAVANARRELCAE